MNKEKMDQKETDIESHSTSVLETDGNEVRELSEAEKPEKVYEQNTENFIAECVMRAEELSPEQRLRVAEYMKGHIGHWHHWNDNDQDPGGVYVTSAEVRDGYWIVTYYFIKDDGTADEEEDKIPLL